MPARQPALTAGRAYSDPVFLDFGVHHAKLDFAGVLDTEAARYDADSFTLDHAGLLQAGGSATLDLAGDLLLPAAKVHIASLELANALPAYVQPFLINSSFKDITGSGTIRGDVELDAGLPVRAGLDLDAIAMREEATGSPAPWQPGNSSTS